MRYILAIEIGNSSVGFALFGDQRVVTHCYVESNTHYTAHHYRDIFIKHLLAVKIDIDAISMVFLASVVPALTDTIAHAVRLLKENCTPLIINGHSVLNITVRPENKNELGSDIILNLAEAWERNDRQASVVVDFGTAVTVSAVDDSGMVCGVAIAPGVTTAMKSLTTATAQLPSVPLQFPAQVMGRDTVSALQSGVLHGYCGLVDSLVGTFQQELRDHHSYRVAASRQGADGSGALVIATGGDGEVMWERIARISTYARELTLCGLLRIGQLNIV